MYELLKNIFKDHKGNIIFNCFGIWHILFMLIIFGGIITILLILKNKDKTVRKKIINITINVVFIMYILDFFIMPLSYGFIDIEKLPFHICTMSCVLCFLSRHNKLFEKYKLHFALLGLVGNIIYVIYPAGVGWSQIAPYSYRVIQTLLYHGLMTLYGLLTIIYDDEKLNWKKCYIDIIIIVLMVLWALLGNTIYNSDERIYNWFFVVYDPFNMLPKNIAPFIMPFIITFVIFFACTLVYIIYFGIKKLINKVKKVIINFY